MWSSLAKKINIPAGRIQLRTFTNSDLNGSSELVITHYKGTRLVIPLALFDSSGIQQASAGLYSITNANSGKISFGGSIDSGTYLLILQFLYV